MATYTIELTVEQDVALAYDVEQMNAQSALMAGSGTSPVWTPEQLLVYRMGLQLDSTYNQIKPMLTTVEHMVASVPQESHEILLATTPSKAIQNYVRAKLTQKETTP